MLFDSVCERNMNKSVWKVFVSSLKNWPQNIIFKISVLFKHFEEETIPFLGHFAPKKLEYQESEGEQFLHNAGKEYKKTRQV